uniref:Transmembrane protease serine 9 n=1 Tax=Phallusia mammillata TaxID=59560 RepID=A0A6F9DVX4_9ASCI|nr:transmembrane protease serine 9 [Phallusia mammillata]
MLCAIHRNGAEAENGRMAPDLHLQCGRELKITTLPDLVVTATMSNRSSCMAESTDKCSTLIVAGDSFVTRDPKICENTNSATDVASHISVARTSLPHPVATRCSRCQCRMLVGRECGNRTLQACIPRCPSISSLSTMHEVRKPPHLLARRSASVPKTFDFGHGLPCASTNNNHSGGAKGTQTSSRHVYRDVFPNAAVPSTSEPSRSSYGPPPSYDSHVDFENTRRESVDVKHSCDARTKTLSALVILLTIITLSTLSVLVYFVVFGNKSEAVNTTAEVNGSTFATSPPYYWSTLLQVNSTPGVSSTNTTATTTSTVPVTDIKLNQTLFCGVFPAKYLPEDAVDVRSYAGTGLTFNPLQPVNDSRVRISSRIVGAQPANIRQYPWQNPNVFPANSNPTPVGLRIVQSRVMGGEDAIVPWQVSLWLKVKGVSRVTCGGSIILRNWILTAAHCTQDHMDEESWTVYAGTSALSERNESPAEKRSVIQIIQHEDYPIDMSYDYDVSLMKLDAPIIFTEVIQPICIPPQSHEFPAGMSCYVSGWGAVDSFGVSSHPDVLQHAQIDIISDTLCNSSEWLDGLITSRMLCAGKAQGVRDACQGDSGGPLSCYSTDKNVWMLAGSVSWGIDCGLPKLPGVYARISYFTDWIWKNIGKAEGWIPQT